MMAGLDVGSADGRRPLVEHVAALTERNFAVTTIETQVNAMTDFDAMAVGKLSGSTAGRHVVVDRRGPT